MTRGNAKKIVERARARRGKGSDRGSGRGGEDGSEGGGDDRLDAVFAALADPTRRRILASLSAGPASVGALAEPFAMSLPAVSKHLRVLERAGLLRRERDGRVHRCHLDPRPLADADAFLARYRVFWDDALAGLARFLEDDPAQREPE